MKNFLTLLFLCSTMLSVFAQDLAWDKAVPFTTQNITKIARTTAVSILISDVIDINGFVEVAPNVTLKFLKTGRLKIANEGSFLIVKGPIDAGIQQIFDVSAKGVNSYRYESISNITLFQNKKFYPEWWGIFPNIIPGQDGDTGSRARNHTLLKELMLDIAASGGGIIQFSEGVYYIRDIVIDSNNITLAGKGKKTILRFDRTNFGFSTRRGGLFTIQGPTLQKFYSKVFPEGVHVAGNFLYDKEQYPIDNIIVRDFVLEWHPDATSDDPAMNGITIVNATNVLVDNVHVNMYGANRAYYVANLFSGDVTEDVTIKNSSCEQSRTGVFVLHGYGSEEKKNNMTFGNITISNNYLEVVPMPTVDVKNEHLVLKYLDPYAVGIYFLGSEYTSSYTENGTDYNFKLGSFLVKDNTIVNADIGIRSWLPPQDPLKAYSHDIRMEGNTFTNFKYVGIFSTFSKAEILNNTFIVDTLLPIPNDFSEENEEEFKASAIHIAKAPWKRFNTRQGPDVINISRNIINGCYLGTTPFVIQPNDNALVTLKNNEFHYKDFCANPLQDIIVTTNRKKFRTKRATLILENNTKDSSNQNTIEASITIDAKRKKHIEIVENPKE
jgi:hypothetical protein